MSTMLRLHSLLSRSHLSYKYGRLFNNQQVMPSRLTQILQASSEPPRMVRRETTIKKTTPIQPTKVKHTFAEGKEIEGFVVKQLSQVPDFHLVAIRLLHQATGAQYLHIEREDPNNAFSIGFRTTPTDSTGLPHILEHTTLCGSKKFPCRDPFFKMLNRSLATFMNAMTGPDYTMYPFSTQNPQDYKNLMSVYLDAVFRPKLLETDFKQEGWRLEHEDVKNPQSPIIFKGVVFNEMKGVFSENQSIFGQQLLNSILPGNTYGHVSGGDPLVIPSLTYEDLKAFHLKYYNPSNSRFYSYGNLPLRQHLEYVNRMYLTESKVSPEDGKKTAVPAEKRWDAERRKHIHCRFDPMAADPKKQSSLAIGYLCSDINNVQETFVLQVISDLLVKGPNSAFYKTLVEPNIGAGFSPVTGYDAQTRDTIFTVGLQGLDSNDFEKVVHLINTTIDGVIDKGFEDAHVEGILHGIELNIKHQSTDFGLGLLFGLTPLWNHSGDLVQALNISHQVSTLRMNLKDNPRYLQEKIEQHFKSNTHKLILAMSPDKDFESNQSKEEQKLLTSKISKLTSADRQSIYQQGLELLTQQHTTEDISCLPTLKISDLKKDVERISTNDSILSSVPIQVAPQPTNGITYFRGIMSTASLSEESKLLLPLFNQIATRMGTNKHDYRAFDQLVQLKTGGIGFSTHIAEDLKDGSKFEEGLMFSTYCLDRNVKEMLNIWSELFNEISLNDSNRFDTLVRVSAADLVNGIADMGHHYAMSSAAALVSPSAHWRECAGGLTYVRKMRDIAQTNDLTPVLTEMRTIASKIFSKEYLRCSTNVSTENLLDILNNIHDFINSLPGSPQPPLSLKKGVEPIGNSSIHHVHRIPVNFVSKSVLTSPYSHPHHAPLRILSRLLTSKYLHPNVREKGGAYGSGVSMSSAGVLSFYSYRDPNSVITLDIFDAAINWVKEDKFTNQDIEEAKLGVFQNVDAPTPPGSKGLLKFLYGIDDDIKQNHRLALMKVNRDTIHDVAEKYLAGNQKWGKALIGPENATIHTRKAENWKVIAES